MLLIAVTDAETSRKMHAELANLVPAGLRLHVVWAATVAFSVEADAVFRMGGEDALRTFLDEPYHPAPVVP